MAFAGFAPTNYSSFTAMGTSASFPLPGGGGATLLITNMGPSPAAFNLSTGAGSCAGSQAGVVVNAGQSLAVTVGSSDHINAISLGQAAQINLAQGT